MSLIVAEGLTKTYTMGTVSVEALKNLTFTIDRASFVSFVGPSAASIASRHGRCGQAPRSPRFSSFGSLVSAGRGQGPTDDSRGEICDTSASAGAATWKSTSGGPFAAAMRAFISSTLPRDLLVPLAGSRAYGSPHSIEWQQYSRPTAAPASVGCREW